MGVEKTEIKKAAYVDVGLTLEKMRDQEELQVAEHRGAARALMELAKKIAAAGTSEIAEKDLERFMQKLQAREAELAELEERDPGPVSMTPLDIIKFALDFTIRAVRQAESMAQSEKNKELVSEGSLRSYETMIQAVRKQVDVTQAQIDRQLSTDDVGDAEHDPSSSVSRPDGVRPSQTIKQRRQAEEAGAQQASSVKTQSEDKPVSATVDADPESSKQEVKPQPPQPKTQEAKIPKAVSPTEVPETAVGPVTSKSPKKKTKKRKGRLESKFTDNGARK